MDNISDVNVTYHFNHAYIKSPKSFGKIRLFQIGDMVCKNTYEIKSHRQFCFEITYVINGELICTTNSTSYKLQKNTLHFCVPNERHKINVNSPQGARFYFLGFDVLSTHPFYDELENLSNRKDSLIRVLNEKHTIYDTITKCLEEISSMNAYSNLLIESYLNEIIVLLLKSYNNNVTQSYRIKDKDLLFSNIISYIENNILEITSTNDICQHFSFSESYLSHLFTEKFGSSLYQYCSDVKFKKAIKLLDDGKSVTDVSEAINYTSIYTFSRAFKNKFGMSPTQYSKQKLQIKI